MSPRRLTGIILIIYKRIIHPSPAIDDNGRKLSAGSIESALGIQDAVQFSPEIQSATLQLLWWCLPGASPALF